MYYPNLRVKAGEVKALKHAPSGWQNQICPIWNLESSASFEKAISDVKEVWPDKSIIDMSRFQLREVSPSAQNFIAKENLSFAIDPLSISDLHSSVLPSFKTNPIFRIEIKESLSTFRSGKLNAVRSALAAFAFKDNTLLLFDFVEATEELIADNNDIVLLLTEFFKLGFPKIVFSTGAFPTTLQDVLGAEELPRLDKRLFESVKNKLAFEISYGDYGTLSPLWDATQTLRSGHIAIRYTLDDDWLVLRQKGKDTASIIELAELLTMHPSYKGRAFSWADENWMNKTLVPPLAGPGNSTGHVAEFMNHHFAQVLSGG
uniref:beta family protein n=1 Tax=Ningiella ruwaisensis TaxID=2364274 RepID=UPI0010A0729E|nr:hypothetical protein [Ningiella ruwaisensis]